MSAKINTVRRIPVSLFIRMSFIISSPFRFYMIIKPSKAVTIAPIMRRNIMTYYFRFYPSYFRCDPYVLPFSFVGYPTYSPAHLAVKILLFLRSYRPPFTDRLRFPYTMIIPTLAEPPPHRRSSYAHNTRVFYAA